MASRGVNKVILVGNVGQDPETRYLPDGTACTTISVATSEVWNNKQTGNEESRTEWHRCVFWGRLAEVVAEYVRKGSKLYIEGKLQTRSWEQDGVKRYATEIVAREMQMLDSRNSGEAGAGGRGGNAHAGQGVGSPETAPSGQQADSFDDDPFNDDIPF